jgi:hypothetical protein
MLSKESIFLLGHTKTFSFKEKGFVFEPATPSFLLKITHANFSQATQLVQLASNLLFSATRLSMSGTE